MKLITNFLVLCVVVVLSNVPTNNVSLFKIDSKVVELIPVSNQEWTYLFNEKNLDGWYMVPQDGSFSDNADDIFRPEDGIIHVFPDQTQNSEQMFAALVTEKEYSDYILSLEYKWGDKKFKPRHESVRDAGVIFHSFNDDVFWPYGVECQIQEGDTGDIWIIGARASSKIIADRGNYDPKGELVTKGSLEKKYHKFARSYSWEKPGWNTIEIEVQGANAIFKVNGHVVNEPLDMRYWSEESKIWKPLTSGKIAIQAEGAELFYRNIKMKKL